MSSGILEELCFKISEHLICTIHFGSWDTPRLSYKFGPTFITLHTRSVKKINYDVPITFVTKL